MNLSNWNINLGPKTKSPVSIDKDKSITTIVNQHKAGEISTRSLLDQYILNLQLKGHYSLDISSFTILNF